MFNKDSVAILRRTNPIGKTRLITIAIELLWSRLPVPSMKEKCFFDYSSFVRQYIDAITGLPSGNFSTAYIKRLIRYAATIPETVSSGVSPRNLPSELRVGEKCEDYRLIWPFLVFERGGRMRITRLRMDLVWCASPRPGTSYHRVGRIQINYRFA